MHAGSRIQTLLIVVYTRESESKEKRLKLWKYICVRVYIRERERGELLSRAEKRNRKSHCPREYYKQGAARSWVIRINRLVLYIVEGLMLLPLDIYIYTYAGSTTINTPHARIAAAAAAVLSRVNELFFSSVRWWKMCLHLRMFYAVARWYTLCV